MEKNRHQRNSLVTSRLGEHKQARALPPTPTRLQAGTSIDDSLWKAILVV